ncbi:AEC family transporter [Paenibacillus agricola]|uniref:AEC family transporter n=1 Tax=Paenibacillus agricola TaxID=2716264 RepID=A0ABX0J7D4_9BACL|nr:AEC family transporter [Paenibacillus agricola]NHN31300.1 AEC family transporter [Paenibacillus agricola]
MLQSFISTIYQVFLPISLPVIGGMLLRRYRGIDTKPISTLSLYVLSPALIFDTLTKAQLSFDDVYKTFAFSLINLLLLWGAASVLGRTLKLQSAERAGLTMVATFTNSVNYGLPLVLLAFGQLGLEKASVYVIGQMFIVNTVGVYFAARSHFSVKQAIRSILTLPSIYAAALAILARVLQITVPSGLNKGIAMMASAYAPVVLVVLGAQMMNAQSAKWKPGLQKALWTGISIRLLLAPLLALLILNVLQIDGILFSVLLILASMPAAVNAVMLAEQFDASPQFVARCILWTTLASFLILPVIIAFIQ